MSSLQGKQHQNIKQDRQEHVRLDSIGCHGRASHFGARSRVHCFHCSRFCKCSCDCNLVLGNNCKPHFVHARGEQVEENWRSHARNHQVIGRETSSHIKSSQIVRLNHHSANVKAGNGVNRSRRVYRRNKAGDGHSCTLLVR
jgi:hypothetical protein